MYRTDTSFDIKDFQIAIGVPRPYPNFLITSASQNSLISANAKKSTFFRTPLYLNQADMTAS